MTEPKFQNKTFWQRPEGIVGVVVLIAVLAGIGIGLYAILPFLITLTQNALYLSLLIIILGALLYMIFDPKMRILISNLYKSVIRSITGVFITIDPIGILKNYIDDLTKNLQNMSKQIGNLRGQMRRLKDIMEDNSSEIDKNLRLAQQARASDNEQQMVLSARKASRLEDANKKYHVLHTKMEVMYKVLSRMYNNAEILLEDTKDQVQIKEQERKAIRTSHSAMRSASSVISGKGEARQMFDRALEAIADDVALKVGEMERFMEVSSTFIDSIDLQNAAFADKGLQMLDQWETESKLLLDSGKIKADNLDLNASKDEKDLEDTRSNVMNDDKFKNLFE